MKRKYFALLLLFCINVNFLSAQEKLELFFDFNQDVPNKSSMQVFKQWLAQENLRVITKIEGYCDDVDTHKYNRDLSVRRAKNVLMLLDSNILDTHKTEIIGFGENFEQSPQQEENRKAIIYYRNTTPKGAMPVEESKLSKQITATSVGEKLKLENLNFYNNSDIVVINSRPILEELLKVMEVNQDLKIEIQGHICCMKEDINKISELRARSVYNFLLSNGINKDRISYTSFGSTKPIYPLPEINEEQRDANRRVEIMVISK